MEFYSNKTKVLFNELKQKLKFIIMAYLILPKRVFNSPLVEYANFEDGSHVNLIRLRTPYANGMQWAVHETTKSPFCSNGLFKSYDKAKQKFDLMVRNGQYESKLLNTGLTGN